ncbi:hypothetical protein [Streptomyces sp. NPDC096153]|uniref:hypothetical protein n=1 Tax=Streptomyces sp. NPDC096153 TaxID=3155548 RepID=UPI00332BB7AA
MRDRTDGYVPEKLLLSGRPHFVEIAPPRDGRPVLARQTVGLADEYNREDTWFWADTSGDGTHWSRFEGHHVQIDVELHTTNRREVNHWKGRDEIRAEGTWTLALARQQVWEGYLRTNVLDQLLTIRRIAQQLLDHPAIDWRDEKPAAEQLLNRRLYYDRTPAVVSSTSVLSQGCVMLKPVGVALFPPHVSTLDRDEDDDPYERDEIKVDLLDSRIWWWRDKPVAEEPDLRPKHGPEADAPAKATPAKAVES